MRPGGWTRSRQPGSREPQGPHTHAVSTSEAGSCPRLTGAQARGRSPAQGGGSARHSVPSPPTCLPTPWKRSRPRADRTQREPPSAASLPRSPRGLRLHPLSQEQARTGGTNRWREQLAGPVPASPPAGAGGCQCRLPRGRRADTVGVGGGRCPRRPAGCPSPSLTGRRSAPGRDSRPLRLLPNGRQDGETNGTKGQR